MVSGLVPAAAEITTWIACDTCNKWRRIPKDLAESVKDDARWCVLLLVDFWPAHCVPEALHLPGAEGSLFQATRTSTVPRKEVGNVDATPTPPSPSPDSLPMHASFSALVAYHAAARR